MRIGQNSRPTRAKKIAKLIGQRCLARRNHFGDQQAREDSVFLREMATNRHPRAFLASQRDFVFAKQRANVLETDRRLIDLHAVKFGDRVDQLRRRNAARGAELVSARLEQVVEYQPQK